MLRVPKGSKALWKYRVPGCGPWGDLIHFGEWADSGYVHGHGANGVFAFDSKDTGLVYGFRLVGFHDSLYRGYGKDYMNSWILLPLGSERALSGKWIVLQEMLSMRVSDPGEGPLHRYKRGEKKTEEVL